LSSGKFIKLYEFGKPNRLLLFQAKCYYWLVPVWGLHCGGFGFIVRGGGQKRLVQLFTFPAYLRKRQKIRAVCSPFCKEYSGAWLIR